MRYFEMIMAVSVCLAVSACAPGSWQKPGGTTADFERDKYICNAEAERIAAANQPAPAYNTNCYGVANQVNCQTYNANNMGSPGASFATGFFGALNKNMSFEQCMTAHGWHFGKEQTASQQVPRSFYYRATEIAHMGSNELKEVSDAELCKASDMLAFTESLAKERGRRGLLCP